jgi:GGDEF domain-containing protein
VLERLRHTAALVEKARTDPLTGLGNRKVLDDALAASSPATSSS